jgi:prevent-host-death family protein
MKSKRIGKSLARERFLPLINELSSQSGAIEITDRGKPIAVLMSYDTYQQMLQKARIPPKSKFKLSGSMTLLGDLEQGSKEIGQDFMKSIERSAAEL